ncbi:MAG: zinc ribbon domain-containing protein [Acidimicrobiales bacterium]
MADESPTPPSGAPGGGASASPLQRLLEVQDRDTVVDQLRHRRSTLPERSRLRDVEVRLSALDQRSKEAQTARDELASRQSALEHQIEVSKARRTELERKMFSGQVAAPRELQAMDEEIKHLARHIGELEDRELEVMEAIEPLDGDLQSADAERDALEGEAASLRNAMAAAEQDLDKEIAEQLSLRQEPASALPPELLARYERLRTKLGGTGAARLVNGSCSGCHLALPAMEVDRIRRAPADTVITCDQCGRILVR